VVVKGVGSDAPSGEFCGSRNAIFYHAEAGSLPGTFSDGQREHGAYSSIQVQVKIPGEEVRRPSGDCHLEKSNSPQN